MPSPDDLKRVEQFTREPFTPDLDAMEPGTARRRAFDAALAEIEAGHEHPSVEWRRDYSLVLGLERVLADPQPRLASGTTLRRHQVDALAGQLAALISDLERSAAHDEEEDDSDEVDDEPENGDDPVRDNASVRQNPT